VGETADLVHAAFERANANDPDGLVALCDPGIEFHDVPEIPGSTVYRGPDGVRSWLRNAHEIAAGLQFESREIEERGAGVMIETVVDMRGRASGAAVDWRFWTVWRVRDGRITYHHGYSRREDAMADLAAG